jgi:prepilin-type N-terminal cleavage/methylation domain-containing protein
MEWQRGIIIPMKQRGFTVIELLVVIVVLAAVGWLFWQQKNQVESAARDDTRRTAINAMYYNLEDVFYTKNKYYPKTISDKNLTAMDKALFKDPDGAALGTSESDYRYEPTGCSGDKCEGYTIRALMENEADFVKTSRNS